MVEKHEVTAALEFFHETIPRFSRYIADRRPRLLVELHHGVTTERSVTVEELRKLGTTWYSHSQKPAVLLHYDALLGHADKIAFGLGPKPAVECLRRHSGKPAEFAEKVRKGLDPFQEASDAFHRQ